MKKIELQKSPKDKLFEEAARLFYERGYRAVGVDTIASASGIGKMTLYRHFPSKDHLVMAYLRFADAQFWQYFEASMAGLTTPRDQILGFFKSLAAYVTGPACCGCPFSNLAGEYPDPTHEGHRFSRSHKNKVRGRFESMASQMGSPDPQGLANSLMMLMDGAFLSARMFRGQKDHPGHALEKAVRDLLGE